jgi:hypothetical protein
MRLLGIDIAPHEVRVARAERTLGALRVVALERIPYDGADALARVLAMLGRARPDRVLSALPAQQVAHRLFTLPFRDRRRIARAAPLELLGQLPVEADGLAVACEAIGPVRDGTLVLVAAVRRADVDAHVALLAAAGLAPARVALAPLAAWSLLPPDGDLALVVADGERSALAIRRAGRLAALRALGASASEPAALAAEVRWSLAALGGAPPLVVVAGADQDATLAGAIGARVVPIAEVTPLALPCGQLAACAIAAGLVAAGRGAPALALGGAPRADARGLRRSAALALAALALAALDLGLARQGLARRDAALVRAIQIEAAASLPGTRLVAPRAQLDAAVAAAARRTVRFGGAASPLELLRELSTRVPPTLRLDLDEATIARDGLVLHGRAESFDAVDALRRALAGSPHLADVTADETRTTVDGRRVEFRLRAAVRAAGGASS